MSTKRRSNASRRRGIQTSDREHEFDFIIYATGFDALTGAFDRIDISGVDGVRLEGCLERRAADLFRRLRRRFSEPADGHGPHAGLGNYTRTAEYSVEWVTGVIRFATERGLTRIEATAEGVAEWTNYVLALGQGQLMNEIGSWMTGVNGNVEGKQKPGSCVTAADIQPIANIVTPSPPMVIASSRWLTKCRAARSALGSLVSH